MCIISLIILQYSLVLNSSNPLNCAIKLILCNRYSTLGNTAILAHYCCSLKAHFSQAPAAVKFNMVVKTVSDMNKATNFRQAHFETYYHLITLNDAIVCCQELEAEIRKKIFNDFALLFKYKFSSNMRPEPAICQS